MKTRFSWFWLIAVLFVFAQGAYGQEKGNFEKLLRDRYEGKILVTVVPGLTAGELRGRLTTTTFLLPCAIDYCKENPSHEGCRESGYAICRYSTVMEELSNIGPLWRHYHESIQALERRHGHRRGWRGRQISEKNRLDAQTFADFDEEQNPSSLGKGEHFLVHKFYIAPNYIGLHLVTIRLRRVHDILRFRFYFDRKIIQAGDYRTVIEEINKYLLPRGEAKKIMNLERNNH